MAGLERVVPIVSGWSQTFDRGMLSDHLATGRVAGLVVVKATVDVIAASHQCREPRGIGANARRRDADAFRRKCCRVQLKAADRVDRRFAEDDLVRASSADPEVARVLARVRASPRHLRWPVPRSSAPIE